MPAWLIPAAAAAFGAYQSSKSQGKANDLNERAVELALKEYNDRAPAREAFMAGALKPIAQAPDLSSAFAASSTNPFYSAPDRSAHVGSQLDLGNIAPPPAPTPRIPPDGLRDMARGADGTAGPAIGAIFGERTEQGQPVGADAMRSLGAGHVIDAQSRPPVPPRLPSVTPAAPASPQAPQRPRIPRR